MATAINACGCGRAGATSRWTGGSRDCPPRGGAARPRRICARGPNLFDAGAVGPVCVLRAEALSHNLDDDGGWCRERGVELAPHGKTHMAPQLLARQFEAGACAVTAATISQVRVYRAFGVRDFVLANELVDAAGLRWLAAELDGRPRLRPRLLGGLGRGRAA